ncbi:MAG: deoxyribonuclease IV [Polyangiales bacterium]
MRVGAHESIAGGLFHAYEDAAVDGCEALQVFTKSSNQWKEPKVDADGIRAFKEARAKSTFAQSPVLSHDSYLINLCSTDQALIERSRASLLAEAERCEAYGIEYVVLHPGAHVGAGVDVGVELAAQGLAYVLGKTRGANVSLLVENTAGQGTTIASRFEEIGAILRGVAALEPTEVHRLGVCLDTCHAIAAGYDLTDDAGYDATMAALDKAVGLKKIRGMHLNDSQKGVGSHLDRHARIGEGALGEHVFWRLMNDARFDAVSAVLETPHDGDDRKYKEQLVRLRAMKGAPPPAPRPAAFALTATEPAPKKPARKAKAST